MARKVKEKKTRKEDILESSDALAERFSRTEDFIKTNRTLVFSIGGVIALIIAGVFIYKYYVSNQNAIAQSEMFQAVYYFEADSLDMALSGDGNNLGFLSIAENYGMTNAGNLARYYAGAAYLKKGEYESAINYLKKFNSSDLLVQARAYALIGDAYMELGNYSDAASYYKQAADYNSNKFFTPGYLMSAALAYEKLGDYDAAVAAYDRIVNEYIDSNEYHNARKHRARLEGLASK